MCVCMCVCACVCMRECMHASQEKHSANAESVYAMESIRIAIKAVHERTSVTLQNGRPLTYVVGHFLVRSHTVHSPI